MVKSAYDYSRTERAMSTTDRRYKSDLTPFGAASSARSPVDDAGLAVDSGRDADGQVVIEMLTVEGGDVTLSRSVNGETFA